MSACMPDGECGCCLLPSFATSCRFLSCCTKVGLSLLRSEFLALERSVPKDALGRINYIHVKQVTNKIGLGIRLV